MMPQALQIAHFDRAGNLPASWHLSADSLFAAARLLKAQRDRYDPWSIKVGDTIPDEGKILWPELMLRGFAIECLLKALYLKRGNKLAVAGKYVGVKGAAEHDLVQLSDAVCVRLTPAQRDVLKRLSIVMTAGGRYPIPRNWSIGKIQRLRGGGKGPPTYAVMPKDDDTLASIVDLLDKELDKYPNGVRS
jgi:hypothetical protein